MLVDSSLLLIGIVLGILVKAYVEPWFRKIVRRESWLEDAMDHAEEVLEHIQDVRSRETARQGFDLDAISREIILSLTPRYGPHAIERAVGNRKAADELKVLAANVHDAWIAVGIARMDAEHGAAAAELQHEPSYAVQRYSTALSNFASAARKRLGG